MKKTIIDNLRDRFFRVFSFISCIAWSALSVHMNMLYHALLFASGACLLVLLSDEWWMR